MGINEKNVLRLTDTIYDKLEVFPFRLIGCPRRNVWTSNTSVFIGSGILDVVGSKYKVIWEGDEVSYHVSPEPMGLMMMRGGKWKSWWLDDAKIMLGMLKRSDSPWGSRLHGVYLVQEEKGSVSVSFLDISHNDAVEAYDKAMSKWDSTLKIPPRLDRGSERGKTVCWKCPVKRRCEALDLEIGETEGWL